MFGMLRKRLDLKKKIVEDENLFKAITLNTCIISKFVLILAKIIKYKVWFYKNVAIARVFPLRGTRSSTKNRQV